MTKEIIPTIHNDYGKITLESCIGFSEIPEQARDLSIKEGFRFNLLVVSRRGLGASTLVNSLFSSPLVMKDRSDGITTRISEIFENEIKLTISVTTYHEENMNKIYRYINTANEEYFEMEQGLSMPFDDNRIHCCLYLVPGDQINESEIQGLKDLSKKVNVIPVITKADMFTCEELKEQREKINKIFKENAIGFYDYEENEDSKFPLAVIASERVYEDGPYKVRGRKYPWGFIDIENEEFSDFKKLQRILIGEKFISLIYKTDTVFYSEMRKNMMKNENAGTSKQQVYKLLEQMDAAIDQKYEQKIRFLENEERSLSSWVEQSLTLNGTEKTLSTE